MTMTNLMALDVTHKGRGGKKQKYRGQVSTGETPEFHIADREFVLTVAEASAAGLDLGQLTKVRHDDKDCVIGTTADVWVEVELGGGWLAAYRITPSRPRGFAEIAELRLLPADGPPGRPGTWSAEFRGTAAICPPEGVNARVVKSIRIGKLVSAINEIVRMAARMRTVKGGPDSLRRTAEVFAPFKVPDATKQRGIKTSAGRPPSIADRDLARIAQAYRAALDRSEPNAADSIARMFNLRDAANVRMRVLRDARKRGLIATAGGRAWRLTPEAEALASAANASDKESSRRSHGKASRKR